MVQQRVRVSRPHFSKGKQGCMEKLWGAMGFLSRAAGAAPGLSCSSWADAMGGSCCSHSPARPSEPESITGAFPKQVSLCHRDQCLRFYSTPRGAMPAWAEQPFWGSAPQAGGQGDGREVSSTPLSPPRYAEPGWHGAARQRGPPACLQAGTGSRCPLWGGRLAPAAACPALPQP